MDLAESLAHRLPDDERHPWEQVRFEFIHSLIRQYCPLAAGDTILDIGCGDGYVVEQFARCYPNCQFIAVDPGFTDEQLLRLPAIIPAKNVQFFKEIPTAISNSAISHILLMDVLEHIDNDIEFLRSLTSLPGVTLATSFVITVPAFEFLFIQRDQSLGHYRRYTHKNLHSLLRNTGLISITSGYFFLLPFLFRTMEAFRQNILHIGRKKSRRLLHWKANILYSAIARTILRLDTKSTEALKIVGLNHIGLSNYCIAKLHSK